MNCKAAIEIAIEAIESIETPDCACHAGERKQLTDAVATLKAIIAQQGCAEWGAGEKGEPHQCEGEEYLTDLMDVVIFG